MDDQLRLPAGNDELVSLRRAQPPKKPPIMSILNGGADKDQAEQTPEEMMLDAVGCTSNVIFIDKENKKIYVANAGDSRCVLSRNKKAVEMSKDHKPTDDSEKERIEKAGSEVTAEGRVDGNLNLSRSLGDLKYKNREHLKPEDQAITANPDTYVFDLTDDIDFILMGCDGIWEKHNNEEAVQWVHDKIGNKKLNELDLKQITEDYLHFNIAVDV